jgi:triosephosphate isomerase
VAIYGGSVTLENYKDFTDINDVGGLLIGGESLNVDKFSEILRGLEIL